MAAYFEVAVSNLFEAETAEDAVLQMVAWLSDWADKAGYRVTDEDDQSVFIDAEGLGIS